MTQDEHRLIVSLLVQREIRFIALLELLRSRGVALEVDDLAAFESLVRQKMEPEILGEVIAEYTKVAESLGLKNDLPKPEPY